MQEQSGAWKGVIQLRLWARYLRERRKIIFLYGMTIFLFLAVGALYNMENLGGFLYAALLASAVWMIACVIDGMKYVCRSRELEAAARHFRQSGELFLEGQEGLVKEEELFLKKVCAMDPERSAEENGPESAKTFLQAVGSLLSMVCGKREQEQRQWAEWTAECRDYYVMWTHQVKTPISAIKLLLEGEGFHDRDNYLLREELFKIDQYVEMALNFQRLEGIASDLVLQEYDLHSLVKQAVRKYSVLFINRGLGLELEEIRQKVVTDEKWFVFCVEQLLSNSIKYTPQGKIIIKGEEAKEPEKKALLIIEDTGIGICPEDLPRIFDRGFTGHNGRLEKKSTGIGLYLCRRIFTHLGISAKVESQEGKGTKVVLGLPVSAPENSRD